MGGIFSRRVPLEGLSKDDIVIVVIGPTGSGKSLFINTASSKNILSVGEGLSPHTTDVAHVKCNHPQDSKRSIVFVDTPSLNADPLTQDEVENKVKTWIKNAYGRKIQIAGILYLHRISDPRITDPPLEHLAIFERLCGNSGPRKVILVTTMWDRVNEDSGQRRKTELESRYWKTMIACGSDVVRYSNTCESAWDAVRRLLEQHSRRS